SALFRPGSRHGSVLLPFGLGGTALDPAEFGDGVAHLFVGPAAADVAGEAALDLGGAGLGVPVQDRAHRDDEAGGAEAALLGVVVGEGGGDRVELTAVDEGLGGLDLLPLGFEGE